MLPLPTLTTVGFGFSSAPLKPAVWHSSIKFTIPLNAIPAPKLTAYVIKTVAVVWVLDKSRSIGFDAGDGRERVEVLREAAQVFIDVSKPNTGIGVERFDLDTVLPDGVKQ